MFMGLVWFSEQTAVISLDRINKLMFVMEKRCVFFEIGTELLYII
jgi:hypothetical protein